MPAIEQQDESINKVSLSPPNEAGLSVWASKPVTAIRGISGRRAQLLKRLKIETWQDLLNWYPRDFENWNDLVSLADLVDGGRSGFSG